jgi:hypothetical protein
MRPANRLYAAALVLLALGGMGGMFWLGQTLADIQSRLHPTPQEEQRRLQAALVVAAEVQEGLGALADDLKADRAVVFLAHNGSTDLTGQIPFMYLSPAYIHLRPGIAWREQWNGQSPLSTYAPTLRRIFKDPAKPVCLRRTITDPDITEASRERMKGRGTERWFTCPLTGKGGVSGFLVVEYTHKEAQTLADADVLHRVAETAGTVHRSLTRG